MRHETLTGTPGCWNAPEAARSRRHGIHSAELLPFVNSVQPPRLLSHRFREITGHSVHDEIAETRLEAARELLLKSTDPVKTIAAACGYPTLQNFYRHFKRRYGTSPQSTSH